MYYHFYYNTYLFLLQLLFYIFIKNNDFRQKDEDAL